MNILPSLGEVYNNDFLYKQVSTFRHNREVGTTSPPKGVTLKRRDLYATLGLDQTICRI